MPLKHKKNNQSVSSCGPAYHLELPLGSKVSVNPRAANVFHTTHLCQSLAQQKSDFDLMDPNGYRLTSTYNCLYDPNLRGYFNRRDISRHLINGGFITADEKVICTAKEFNKYRDYLAEVQMDWDRHFKMELKQDLRTFLDLQEQGKIPADVSITDVKEWLLQRGKRYFSQQLNLDGDRTHPRQDRSNEHSAVKRPKIEKQSSLAKIYNNKKDRFVRTELVEKPSRGRKKISEWKEREQKMLEEVMEELQREVRLKRHCKVARERRDKQKPESSERRMAFQEKKSKSLREAVMEPADGLANVRNPLHDNTQGHQLTSCERRPSLDKLKPLPGLKRVCLPKLDV